MNDLPSSEPDPFAQWLAVSRSPEASVAVLHQAVLQRTLRVLRLRRWGRRAAIAAALAACYAGGLATMHWLTPPAPGEVVIVVKSPDTPTIPVPPPPAPSELDDTEPPAVALEWHALDHPESKVEYYRRAGDHYLADSNDLQAAIRCYRQMLDAGSEKDLAISPDDNWLLMALKDARQKEKVNAKPN